MLETESDTEEELGAQSLTFHQNFHAITSLKLAAFVYLCAWM